MSRVAAHLSALLVALAMTHCARPRTRAPTATHASATTPPTATPARPSGEASSTVAERTPAPAPPIVGAIGGALPTTFEAAAADRRWLLFCQASRDTNGDGKLRVSLQPHGGLAGDRLDLYLKMADAAPERVDAFWGSDPSERWLIVKEGSSAVVIDTSKRVRRRLENQDADLAEIGENSLPHRALAFDSARERLLFARRAGTDRFEVRARSLATWQEEKLYAGRGRLWKMRASEDGHWLVIQRVVEDTSGNGRLDLPAPMTHDKPRCHGPIPQFSAWLPAGDQVTTTLLSLDTGRATDVHDLAAPFGKGFLYRDNLGQLWLDNGRHKQRLADRACGAQVIHADPSRGLVLAGCRGPAPLPDEDKRRTPSKKPEPPRTRWPLRLLGPGLDRDLELDLGPTGNDRWPSAAPRLLAVHAGAQTRLLDMDRRRLLDVDPGTWIVATHGTRALLLERQRLTLVDATHQTKLLELDGVAHAPTLMVREPSVLVSPYVVDLEKAKMVGRVTGNVLALSADGLVLEAQGDDSRQGNVSRRRDVSGPGELPLGPLVWRTPVRP